jgi:hypothetical protein
VCTPEERLIFQVFLCSGFSEWEVATLAWTDIHWKEGKLVVSAKPELGLPICCHKGFGAQQSQFASHNRTT